MNGKRYYYKVVAVINGVNSKPSNIATVIVYPYKLTALGDLRINIISRSHQTDFILGSYIPVQFELILNKDVKDISIHLNDITKVISTGNEPFTASIVNGGSNAVKAAYINSEPITNKGSRLIISDNKITLLGEYSSGENIKIEFLIKVSAKASAVNDDYNNDYNLKFDLSAKKQDADSTKVEARMYEDGTNISLKVKITNPNKLN